MKNQMLFNDNMLNNAYADKLMLGFARLDTADFDVLYWADYAKFAHSYGIYKRKC